ncbi:T6SS effector BTH_I2691 family protein [Herbaspirillum huttiense]|uniref:T6SS effector BTH_I2691 family protein n=1 Tax=Herbaspirillum huttiense TaxID=863372 RepID=UPI00380318B3
MNGCNFCDKKGLLIYPVRYAVASPYGAAGVPGLSGNFRIEGAPQSAGAAKYSLRALRPGYLYTYDEKRGRLKAYVVMPTGHLWNYPLEYNAPHPAKIRFACIDPGELVRAYCVDIIHTAADPAGNFWIGWSNVQWTKALLKKVSDAGWRKKHMQCIDIPAMLAGSAAHTGEFNACADKVAHFVADEAAMKKAYAFSNTPTESETRKLATAVRFRAIMAEHGPHHKGYIAALNDPVGMTNDLSELTVPDLQAGFDEKLHQRKMIADLLALAEYHVRQEARQEVVFSDEVAEASAHHPDGDIYNGLKTLGAMFKLGGIDRHEKKLQEQRKKYGEDLAGRQQAAADDAWHELTHDNGKPALDEAAMKSFPAIYVSALMQFVPQLLQLLMAHLGWLKSEQLANWMEGVHDDADIRSGYAYSESMSQCIGKAVCSKPCIDQLSSWISSGNLQDKRNLYARALLLNHADIIAATETQLKGSDFQFENILNVYKGAVLRLDDPKQAEQLIDRLALTTGNVIVKAISGSSTALARAIALTHLQLLGGVGIKVSNMSRVDVAQWAIAQAKEQGIKLETDRKKTRADARTQAREAVKRARVQNHFYYALDIGALEKDGRIAPGSIKGIGIPGVTTAKNWLGSGSPRDFKLGVVTMIVQMAALQFAMTDLDNNDQFNLWETRVKATAAITSLSATIVEAAAISVKDSSDHPLSAFIRRQWAGIDRTVGKIIFLARTAGLLAGLGVAAWDIFDKGWEALKDEKFGLASLYFLNGILGARIAFALFFSLGSLFWPIFLLSFGIGIAIAYVNNSALKTWIAHCEFSAGIKYTSFEAELKGYRDAVGVQ